MMSALATTIQFPRLLVRVTFSAWSPAHDLSGIPPSDNPMRTTHQKTIALLLDYDAPPFSYCHSAILNWHMVVIHRLANNHGWPTRKDLAQ